MAFSPPKGLRPPQFEGKRTGRPKGSRNYPQAWRDCLWGYQHSQDFDVEPPTPGAALWQAFAAVHYWEVHDWLEVNRMI